MRNTKKNPGFTNRGTGFRTVGSKIGQLIGRDFSPAVFADEKMRSASLSYYVGDRRTILMVAPQLASIIDQLPGGKILFFHCEDGSLTKKEICDFFNRVCTSVPFRIEPDELYQLGTIPYSRGIGRGGDMHTYYGFDLDPYEPTPKNDEKKNLDISTDVPAKFEEIKKKDRGLQDADASVRISGKDELEKYFRRDRTGLNKLDSEARYLVVFSHEGEMDEGGVATLSNDLNKSVGGGMKDGGYSDSDVIVLGQIRKKYPASGNFENYDVFAVGVGR